MKIMIISTAYAGPPLFLAVMAYYALTVVGAIVLVLP